MISGNSGINLIYQPTWLFDFTTDGHSITYHTLAASYNGTFTFAQRPGATLDFALNVVERNATYALHDSTPDRWQTEPNKLPDAHIVGHYRNGAYENSFDLVQPIVNGLRTEIVHTDYPNSLQIGRLTGDVQQVIAFIPLEPGFNISNITLAMWQFMPANLVTPNPCACGDYNRDGNVDAADYVIYRDLSGKYVLPYSSADGNGDGFIGDADYQLWQATYGHEASSASNAPEPAALVLSASAMIAAHILVGRRRPPSLVDPCAT
jgi:hypothetical protein